jgi:hypothetical protein
MDKEDNRPHWSINKNFRELERVNKGVIAKVLSRIK